MSRAVSPSVDRVYGLARVARCWRLSRASLYRHQQAPVVPKRRPGPVGPCDDAALLEHIKNAIAESRFTGEGYRKIWARLRFAGIRSSPGRVRRLMGATWAAGAAPGPQAAGQAARRQPLPPRP